MVTAAKAKGQKIPQIACCYRIIPCPGKRAGETEGGRVKIRTTTQIAANMAIYHPSGAESGAGGARDIYQPPDLAEVVNAWPTLTKAFRAGILAIVRSTQ